MTTPTQTPPAELSDAALAAFTDYFVRNYPKDTIIGVPNWHAPKIFRAAKYAIEAARDLPAASLGEVVTVPAEPTDSMVAEAVYNTNRKYDTNPVDAAIVRAVWSTMLWARPAPTPSTAGSGDAAHDFSDNEGATCLNCGTSNWAACTPCSPPAKPEAGEVVPDGHARVLREMMDDDYPTFEGSGQTYSMERAALTAAIAALTAKAEGDGGDQFGAVNDMVGCRCVEGSRDAELCMDKHECRRATATTKAHP